METKDRATRRAHGQRGGLPRVKWIAENGRTVWRENGAQRADRRAAAKGLTVGAPVRAVVMTKTRPGPQRPLSPLERIDRMARYLLQRDVTTHVRQGPSWQPTARQRRRLDKKERAAALRTYLAGKREEARYAAENPRGYALAMTDTRGPAASAVIVDEPHEVVTNLATGEQRTEPPATPVSPQQFAGFRVTDRRGEHRS